MRESISLNRQFLTMAREAASSPSGEIATGLSRAVLNKIGQMSLEQIELIAASTGVSLISFRLTPDELDRLTSMTPQRGAAYAMSLVASKKT